MKLMNMFRLFRHVFGVSLAGKILVIEGKIAYFLGVTRAELFGGIHGD
jgi:hypothetical protein